MLAGKSGVVQCHMGDGARMLELIERVLRETEIPAKHFVPTHMNRSPELFEAGAAYAKNGGYVDFTTSTTPLFLDEGEVKCSAALGHLLGEGVPAPRITFSSDGQGSLPEFDAAGNMRGLKVGTSASLWPEVRDAVKVENVPLDIAVRVITTNAAGIYKLPRKGRLAAGYDADATFVDADTLEIRHVIARGRVMVRDGKPIVKGTFE
jgi:beta-aspartyl-dipeptidase (metallo-type)